MKLLKIMIATLILGFIISGSVMAANTGEKNVEYVKTEESGANYKVLIDLTESSPVFFFTLTGAAKEDYWLNLLMINLSNPEDTRIVIEHSMEIDNQVDYIKIVYH